MARFAVSLGVLGIGCAAVNASAPGPAPGSRESAGHAAFLFAVIGILLAIFFAVVLLTTVSRAIRRKRLSQPGEPTDLSVDAWAEAGKRLGKPTQRRGRGSI